MVQHRDEEQLVELKGRRELRRGGRSDSEMRVAKWLQPTIRQSQRHTLRPHWAIETDLSSHLPDAVDELDEEGRALGVGVVLVTVTHALQHAKQDVSADVP